MWVDLLFICGSYLLGSLPHLHLLARIRHVQLNGDFHQSLWSRGGKLAGVAGVIGEFIKGALPVLVARWIGLGVVTEAASGLAAVCGQMWPLFSRFDGEKGNSIALAMVISVAPVPALTGTLVIIMAILARTLPRLRRRSGRPEDRALVGGTYSRALPLGMAAYFFLVPFLSWFSGEPAEIVVCSAVIFVLIMIRRVFSGLRADLKTGENIRSILLRRLLYDRATAEWRS